MTPEEKFYSEVWRLLKEIKEKYLATPKKQVPSPQNEYIHITKPHGVEIWLNYGSLFKLRKNIIYKLEEWKILKVLDETRGDFNYEGTRFILKILQPRFNKVYQSWEEIDENPWLSEESKIAQTKKILEGRQKQFGKNIEPKKRKNKILTEKSEKNSKINFPTDPEVIEEYLNILNRIEKERQRTPEGEPIAFPVPKGTLFAKGVPLPDEEASILRKLDGLIKTTQKTIPFIDPLGLDPYENIKTIRAVEIPDLDKLKDYRAKLFELKKQSNKPYKERKANAEARAKEMRRQFEELDEKQKEKETLKKEIIEETNKKLEKQRKVFEKLRKQISSLVPRNSVSAFKQYGELLKEISKQSEPIKDALEKIGRLQSTTDYVKNSLTPALQRFATSAKQMEEAMKTLKEHSRIETPNAKALIPSDIRRARQEAETLSELREIRTILQGFLTEKTKKNAVKGVQGKTPAIGKIEIIGRDKIEQHGNKNTAKIKNIAGNRPSKKFFSMNNPIVAIIISVIAGIILYFFYKIFK